MSHSPPTVGAVSLSPSVGVKVETPALTPQNHESSKKRPCCAEPAAGITAVVSRPANNNRVARILLMPLPKDGPPAVGATWLVTRMSDNPQLPSHAAERSDRLIDVVAGMGRA